MSAVGTKLRKAKGTNRMMLLHWCPACDEPHGINIKGDSPIWSFDGNWERPTFHPSVLCFTNYNNEGEKLPDGQIRTLCHYFIKDGKIDFCSDNPHKLNGQTVDLPAWPYAPGTYGGIDE